MPPKKATSNPPRSVDDMGREIYQRFNEGYSENHPKVKSVQDQMLAAVETHSEAAALRGEGYALPESTRFAKNHSQGWIWDGPRQKKRAAHARKVRNAMSVGARRAHGPDLTVAASVSESSTRSSSNSSSSRK